MVPLHWGPVEPAETTSADTGSVLAPVGIPEDPGEVVTCWNSIVEIVFSSPQRESRHP